MRFIFVSLLTFVFCVSTVSHAEGIEVENHRVISNSILNIKLHGTIKIGNGASQAIISMNNGEHYMVYQSEEISNDVVLADIYSDYVLLNTPQGITTIEMSDSEITFNEAHYDGNLEVGQSRTLYEPLTSGKVVVQTTSNER